jgi:hypothetical protein
MNSAAVAGSWSLDAEQADAGAGTTATG